jgi:hypothetical protein
MNIIEFYCNKNLQKIYKNGHFKFKKKNYFAIIKIFLKLIEFLLLLSVLLKILYFLKSSIFDPFAPNLKKET